MTGVDLTTIDSFVLSPAALDCADWAPGDAFLAGGTWLFSTPQPQLRRLRDLTGAGWPPIVVIDEAGVEEGVDEGLELAATCTLAQLHEFQAPAHWRAAALIGPCCEALLGSFKVWNEATVGGNICLSLAAAPMVSLTAALDGVALLWGADGSRRSVPVAHFVTGAGTNVLRPGELLRSVRITGAALHARTAFRRFSLSEGGRSAGLVIGRTDPDGRAVITITAATLRPIQLRFARTPSAATALTALESQVPVWNDDVHGLPQWRADLTRRDIAEVCEELLA